MEIQDARSRFLELLHPLMNERLMNAELGTESAMVFSPQRAARATLALKAGAWFFRLDMCVLLGWLSSYHAWPNLGDHLLHPCPQTFGWRKRGQHRQALGRSRGGFTSKLHAQVDALGNPVSFFLTGGECADISVAPQLLEGVCNCTVIADKGYDSEPLVQLLEAKGCTVVIPPRSNRKTPPQYDRHLYKEQHLVRCSCLNKFGENLLLSSLKLK